MNDMVPFLRRQPVIIMLGVVGWMLAVWQLGKAALAQNAVLSIVLIALNGVGPVIALLRLFWLIVTTRRWQRNNHDPFIWLAVLITYGSAAALAGSLRLDATGGFFLAFLLVNMAPLMNRFRAPLAIAMIVLSSLAVTLLQQALPTIPFGLYALLAQSALWYMASSNIDEWQAHQETATAHAQLNATQQLLAQAVARNERTRIARDLHDQMGHHLVALNMQLQVLERKLPPEAGPELGQARELARELFEDVRSTLQQLRLDLAPFAELLGRMLDNIPYLKFSVAIDDDLLLLEEPVATCLLRVIQEAITNTLKHSDATRLEIRLARVDGEMQLRVEDNGRHVRQSEFGSGSGLSGLVSRLEEFGGRLMVTPTPQGFCLLVGIPEEGLS